ncbi:MAG: hypothetical protein QGG36_14825 [Pirellulaceae bacterium]|jgi:hypothetical protein|nr:hypothetical protein [Pirellulaceae bacterium]MDP7017077.1 hypothetical protein [Pirellulaceae bacterium]
MWRTGLLALCLFTVSILHADDQKRPEQLPKPLDRIAIDLGSLDSDFEIAKVEYFASGQFSTTDPRPRVVAEETLVFTLRAKREISGARMNKLLANPFPRARFVRAENGKPVAADARKSGYGLFHNGRWLGKAGPPLKRDATVRLWTHLGDAGSAGLHKSKATSVVLDKKQAGR